ncbi:MAG: hypothetical protein CMF69_10475 [Magnetovibrio sp.]|nr:hypothetical protein [Magnetovibrio sp.]
MFSCTPTSSAYPPKNQAQNLLHWKPLLTYCRLANRKGPSPGPQIIRILYPTGAYLLPQCCKGDLVIWDNRSVLHRGRTFDPNSLRVMHRATIAGDGPLI